MSPSEKLKFILEKMILPDYKDITSVDVKVYGGAMDMFFYEIYYTYSEDSKPNKFVMKSILDKTISLFKMLDFGEGNDLNVLFVVKEK